MTNMRPTATAVDVRMAVVADALVTLHHDTNMTVSAVRCAANRLLRAEEAEGVHVQRAKLLRCLQAASMPPRAFVALIIACALDQELLQSLLQQHPSDAVDEVSCLLDGCATFIQVAADESTAEDVAAIVHFASDTLTHALVLLLLGCMADQDALSKLQQRLCLRQQRYQSWKTAMAPSIAALRHHLASRANGDTAELAIFLQMPMDNGSVISREVTYRTRDDRRTKTMKDIAAQQQRDLAAALDGDQGVEEGTLWDAVRNAELVLDDVFEWATVAVPSTAVHSDTPESTQPTKLDCEQCFHQRGRRVNQIAARHIIQPQTTETETKSVYERATMLLDGNLDSDSASAELAKLQHDLSSIDDTSELEVHVAMLLSLQQQRSKQLCDCSVPNRLRLGREVKRAINKMTSDSDSTPSSVRQLVELCGLCPQLLLQEIIADAAVSTARHVMFLRVLSACSLLINWTGQVDDDSKEAKSVFCQLLRETTSSMVKLDKQSFERRKQDWAPFLVKLCSPKTPLISRVFVTQNVLFPVICEAAENQASSNALVLLYEWVSGDNATNHLREVESASLSELWRFLVIKFSTNAPSRAVQEQETLLLLLGRLLEAAHSTVVSLLVSFACEQGIPNTTSLLPLLLIHATAAPLLTSSFPATAPLNDIARSQYDGLCNTCDPVQRSLIIRCLLWRLIWDNILNVEFKSATRESIVQALEVVAQEIYSQQADGNGGDVIAYESARLLTSCGRVLFRAFCDWVLPVVSKHVQFERCVIMEGVNVSPNAVTMQVDMTPERQALLLLVRAWSLWALKPEVGSGMTSDALCQCLLSQLSDVDRLVTAACSSQLGALFCVQFLLCASRLAAFLCPTANLATASMSLLMVLRHLDSTTSCNDSQSAVVPVDDAKLFVASWLAQLPDSVYQEVRLFLPN